MYIGTCEAFTGVGRPSTQAEKGISGVQNQIRRIFAIELGHGRYQSHRLLTSPKVGDCLGRRTRSTWLLQHVCRLVHKMSIQCRHVA
jgi:hypothetical protein